MSFLNPVNFGVNKSRSFYENRSVKITNTMSIITIIGILLGISTSVFLGNDYPKTFQFIILLLTIFVLILNRSEKFAIANYLWVLVINSAVLFSVNYYGGETGAYVFYFPLFVGLGLLYNPGLPVFHIYIYYFISLVFLLSSVYLDLSFIPHPDFSPENIRLLYKYNISFSIFATGLMIAMMLYLINHQNKELITLLEFEKMSQRETITSLKEKELLVAEIHHRVKNNLTVICSLINLQLAKTENIEAIEQMSNIKNRILSISKAHNMLYKTKDFAKVNIEDYLKDLIDELKESFSHSGNISFELKISPVKLDVSKAVPLGLVINECVTNSLKHAFPAEYQNRKISILIEHDGKSINLKVSDNGIGFKNPDELQNAESLGITLIASLAEQLDGIVRFTNEGGAQTILNFKE